MLSRVPPEGNLGTAELSPSPVRKSSWDDFSSVPSKVRWLIYSLFFTQLGIGYLSILVTGYFLERGFTAGAIGLLTGVFGIVPVALGIPLGILSDRRGRKWLLILGSLAVPCGLIFFAVTSSINYLLLSSVVFGLGEAATLTTWNAIIADQTTLENRAAAFSLSFVVSNVSFGMGFAIPFSFPTLENLLKISDLAIHNDFMIGFCAIGFLTPLWIAILLRGYEERTKHVETIAKELRAERDVAANMQDGDGEIETDSRRRKRKQDLNFLLKFSFCNALIGLGAGFIIPLIPTWLFLRFGVHDTYSGPLLAISNVTIAFAGFFSPRLSRKYGLVKSIVTTEGLSTIFMLSLAFVGNAYMAAGIYVVRAALMNMASPLSDSFVMSGISPDDRGLASAINSIVWRLPNSGSTIVGGLLLQEGIYNVPFFLAGGLYIVSISSFYTLFRKTPKR